MGDWLKG